MKLELVDFFKYFIIHPDSDLLDNKTDRVTALISSIALGIFTLGLCHLVCAVAFRSYKPIEPGSRIIASDVARRVLDANPPLEPPIDREAADIARLEKLGFTSDNVYTKIRDFLNSPDGSLSLGADRVITIRNRLVSLNFSDSEDVKFLLQKALEGGKGEDPADLNKFFLRALQVCHELGIDNEEILRIQPLIPFQVRETSLEAGALGKKECMIPSDLLRNSSVLKNMLLGLTFESADFLVLPEGYTVDHFEAYLKMSSHADYDFSAPKVLVLLDILLLADYFVDKDLVSRLDKALKACTPSLDDLSHLLEIFEGYPQLEVYISPFIHALIRNAINTGTPLKALVHSLNAFEWFKTHTLALDLERVDDTVLENLSGLKVSSLTIQSSKVTRLPDAWLTSLHALNITDTEITVLQQLPELKSLRVSQQGPLIDISSLDGHIHLENIDINRGGVKQLPTGLTGLKKLRATNWHRLTDLNTLNGCTSLEELRLDGVSIVQLPTGLTGLKTLHLYCCCRLTDLDVLNGYMQLEELDLISLAINRLPTGLTSLKKFFADFCPRLTDLEALSVCADLKKVQLLGLTNLTSIPPSVRNAQERKITNCPLITAA